MEYGNVLVPRSHLVYWRQALGRWDIRSERGGSGHVESEQMRDESSVMSSSWVSRCLPSSFGAGEDRVRDEVDETARDVKWNESVLDLTSARNSNGQARGT